MLDTLASCGNASRSYKSFNTRLEGKSVVSSRWLYKIKHVINGNIKKFKVRFVARGFS
jgi:hypothetical protein